MNKNVIRVSILGCYGQTPDHYTNPDLHSMQTVSVIQSSFLWCRRRILLQQNRLRWYGHVLRKDDDDWVKKWMEYEAEGSRPRGRPKRTWKEVVWEDCQAHKLNKEDAVDHCKWRKVIKEVRWPGLVWAGECFFWYRPTWVVPDKRPLNGCCIAMISDEELKDDLAGSTANVVLIKDNKIYCVSTEHWTGVLYFVLVV